MACPILEQLRAILAAKIIGVLDDRQVTIRKAREPTGIAAADFSRIRKLRLERFTVDRLGQDVEVSVEIHARTAMSPSPAEAVAA